MVSIPALLSAIVIGISLGLIGGGGSILTVPALTYLANVDVVAATAYSLFIVGLASGIGSINFIRNGQVDLKTAAVFAVPSLTAVWLTRRFLIPAIPEELFMAGDFMVSKDLAIMIFFALIMILASVSMIRKKRNDSSGDEDAKPQFNFPVIMLEGFVVGTVTGIVGAGGGFLIIPALVVLAKIPMKKAIGTSLLIISVKSLIGFTGDLSNPAFSIDWGILLPFAGLAVVGIFVGTYLGKFIPGAKLKKGFGVFILLMGIYIISERISKMEVFVPETVEITQPKAMVNPAE